MKNNFSGLIRRLILATSIIAIAWIVMANYSLIFAKTIRGPLLDVKKVNDSDAAIITGRKIPAEYLFSFAIAIEDSTDHKIYTASTEDRNWAAAREGRCAVVKIFPHPPWDFNLAGTYFNARLLEQYPCAEGAAKAAAHNTDAAPAPVAPPASTPAPVATPVATPAGT